MKVVVGQGVGVSEKIPKKRPGGLQFPTSDSS